MLDVALQVFTFLYLFLLAVAVGLLTQPFTMRATARSNRRGCGGARTRGGGGATGGAGAPLLDQEALWYDSLPLAPWQPPAVVFGIVWPVLYAALVVAGWLVLREGRVDALPWQAAVGLWLAQLLLNAAWTPMFYGLRSPPLGLGILILKLVAAGGLAYCTWAQDPATAASAPPTPTTITAFVLQLVYAAWIVFATTLNGYTVFAPH